MKSNRYVPFITGVACLIVAYFSITQLSGVLGTIIGAGALGGAYHGIKDAITMTDEEIKEATRL